MTAALGPLARALADEIKARPQQFHELADAHRAAAWPDLLRAWGELRRARILKRDEDGNYLIA